MTDNSDFNIEDIEQRISRYFNTESVQSSIQDAIKKNLSRITIDINKMRESDPSLVKLVLKSPLKIIPLMERRIDEIAKTFKNEKAQTNTIQNQKEEKLHLNLQGMLGTHLVSPRGLTADLTNQYVGVQGIVTRISEVR